MVSLSFYSLLSNLKFRNFNKTDIIIRKKFNTLRRFIGSKYKIEILTLIFRRCSSCLNYIITSEEYEKDIFGRSYLLYGKSFCHQCYQFYLK